MRITRFERNENNEEHIAIHGIEPSEAEEVLRSRHVEQKGRRRVRLAWGTTALGRHLLVVFVARRRETIRVVTARDMTDREKRRFRRRRR